MRWSELDLNVGIWTLSKDRTKTAVQRELPLPSPTTTLLAGLARIEGRDLVFGEGTGPYSGFSRSKQRLDERSGVEDWILHDLRRSWDTHAQDEFKIAPHIVDEVLGHIGGHRQGARKHYNHALYRDPKRLALQRYADWLLGIEAKIVPLRA